MGMNRLKTTAAMTIILVLWAIMPAAAEPVAMESNPEEPAETGKISLNAWVDAFEYYKDQGITTGVLQPNLCAEWRGAYISVMANYDARGTKGITEIKTSLGYELGMEPVTAAIDYSYRAFMGPPAVNTVCENEITLSIAGNVIFSPCIEYTRCVLAAGNYVYFGASHELEVAGSKLSIATKAELALNEGYRQFTQLESEARETFSLGDNLNFSAFTTWSLSFDQAVYVNGLFFGVSVSWETGI